MRSRSSTSSSDGRRGLAWILAALVAAAILYLPLRGAVLRSQSQNGYGLSDDVAIFLRGDEQPRIVVAGTSRNGLGVHEKVIEDAFGTSCVKLPINASTAFEVLQLLRRHPERFEDTKLLVLDIEPYQFNRNSPDLNQSGNSRKAFCAPFPRLEIREVMFAFQVDRNFKRMDSMWNDDPRQDDTGEDCDRMDPVPAADRFCSDYAYNSEALADLMALEDVCDELDIELLLNVPPARKEHIDYLKSGHAAAYAGFLRSVDSLRESGARVSFLETFSPESGSDDDLFIDYGHLREKGAILYTDMLIDEIRSDETLLRSLM